METQIQTPARPAMQGKRKWTEADNAALLAASVGSPTPSVRVSEIMDSLLEMASFAPAKMLLSGAKIEGMRPLPSRYYDTKLSVESVLHNLDTAVFKSPHEDDATEEELARMVNALAKLRLALQEVPR